MSCVATTKSKAGLKLFFIVTFVACATLMIESYRHLEQKPLLASLNYSYYDFKQKIAIDSNSVEPAILVVEIDDTSLLQLGRWPWPRKITADLIESLFQRGADKIVLDIIFAEASDNANDQALIEVIKKHKDQIVLGSYVSHSVGTNSAAEIACLEEYIFTKKNNIVTEFWRNGKTHTKKYQQELDVLYLNVVQQQLVLLAKKTIFDLTDSELTYINSEYAKQTADFCHSLENKASFFAEKTEIPSDVLLNFDQLQNESPATGVFSVSPDGDGSIRRYYFSYPLSQFSIPSSSGLLGSEGFNKKPFWINYSKKIPLKISALEILKDKNIDLKGQTVFLGVTSPGVYDIRKTPVAAAFPGTYILAQAASNILNKNYFSYWPWAFMISVLFILLLAMQTIYLNQKLSWKQSLLFLAALLLALVSTEYILSLFQYFFWSLELFVFWMAAFILNNYLYYRKEITQKAYIKSIFSKYIADHIVEDLLKNPDKINLVGEKRNLAIFFSDIRNFTSISEKLDPLLISRFLNIYFNPMVQIIKSNHGTVDKFIGDGLMSFFGAPVPHGLNSENACLAALQSIQALAGINAQLKNEIESKISIGIGLNEQEVFVGNIGAEQLQSYTVIGDGVNLAARLQGLTKKYQMQIITSESIYEKNKHKFSFKKLDCVQVKGRAEAIWIYALLQDATHQQRDTRFEKILDLFFAQQLKLARFELDQYLHLYPSDSPANIIASRLKSIEENPASNWDTFKYGSS